jgi:hypothetical protein
VDLKALSDSLPTLDVVPTTISQSNTHDFRPFPNKNSFLLSDWYWNQGIQKSQNSFRDLLAIVGNPEFEPDDVRCIPWSKINAKLGHNDLDGEGLVDEEDKEWMDEDRGWKRSPINISVPFHHRAKNPGAKNYHAGYLYHRSLGGVIREKLRNAQDNQGFHYEPFEVFWRPTDSCPDVRVHSELYTSPAFLDAHRQLQESPGEPGCDLPRVVVAMMFSSDATHLTAFGTAQLWPCYLFFGNESKYRRCKPSSNLCNHVAYFQAVSCHFV